MIHGQDYSHYQINVNFPLAVENGQEWFYLKCSEGSRPGRPPLADDKYASHSNGARGTGKPFGPYHFLTMYQKAEEQVAWMKQCAPDPTPLPPILDAEQHPYEPINSSVPLANKRTHVHNWLLEGERLFGRKPLIYTGVYWWKDNIGDVPWAKDYQFIIAGYLFYKQVIPANFNIWWPGPRTLFYIPRENVIGWQWAGDIPNNGKYPWASGTQDFNVADEKAIWALAGFKPPLTIEERVSRLEALHPELGARMPNERVNWESLHREIMAQSDERHKMELRIVGVLSDGLQGIRGDMRSEREACGKRFDCIEDDIVGLKVADRRWGGIVGLFAAGVAGLGAWLGQR